jgi:ATP-binding cassette subfamily B protein
MIAAFYGKHYSLEYLREQCYLSRDGVSMLSLNDAAEGLGFRTFMTFLDIPLLVEDAPLPAILHWDQNHFVVLYKIKRPLLRPGRRKFIIADPAQGIAAIDEAAFIQSWISTADQKGAALFLETTAEFHKKTDVKDSGNGYRFLFQYVIPYKGQLLQLVLGMVLASLITAVVPILTQVMIDNGVMEKNLSIVALVLASQLFLFLGSTAISMVRSWLLLHVNARISLNIISDFLIKLVRLPIKYFDTKTLGDLSQRINDHHRIENFLTGDSLSTLFSLVNISIFTVILGIYNWKVFLVFLVTSAMGVTWILLFQNKRKQLNYKWFFRNKENQDKLIEMITGMQEIKLFGSETAKRWEWEELQVKNFRLNIKSLAIEQYQQSGYIFLTQLKNILISFLAARAAVEGKITLGGLLSVSYIIGQINGPLEQLIGFVRSAQDAKLSMDRLLEIHNKKNEEEDYPASIPSPAHEDIIVRDLSFRYEGPHSPLVLDNISLTIPKGKVTAIVGASGSGKTTLIKLLLNFYKPTAGDILVGSTPLTNLSPKAWRSRCGTVMQEGYIFSDTIARNIALDGQAVDEKRMEEAIQIAQLQEFLDKLPSGYTTKIGNLGVGISGGQRQRILIARAVYKDPQYLFFDEATSSLDANNERAVMNGLNSFFEGKTVVIIAHRLSTVKNADQIIVLEHGRIVETGIHDHLVGSKGKYFGLVKNQLELGK